MKRTEKLSKVIGFVAAAVLFSSVLALDSAAVERGAFCQPYGGMWCPSDAEPMRDLSCQLSCAATYCDEAGWIDQHVSMEARYCNDMYKAGLFTLMQRDLCRADVLEAGQSACEAAIDQYENCEGSCPGPIA